MFQFPGFPLSGLCIHPEVTGHDSRLPPGFPIRISTDQCLLATPRSFSQLAASLIGVWCLGIRPVLLFASFIILRPCHFFPVTLAVSLPLFYLLDWLSRKTHFRCAVVKIRLAFRSPLLASGLNPDGGSQWTRTIDLSLIRRVL